MFIINKGDLEPSDIILLYNERILVIVQFPIMHSIFSDMKLMD
jgi:hypothetical protein